MNENPIVWALMISAIALLARLIASHWDPPAMGTLEQPTSKTGDSDEEGQDSQSEHSILTCDVNSANGMPILPNGFDIDGNVCGCSDDWSQPPPGGFFDFEGG